jgi:tetratricopeptide (TPR) repeat protein
LAGPGLSNKEKLLESAQKSLQKGQVARAIKDYQKIVEIDPRDVRSRQKLAELFSRDRRIDEALDAYEGVAKYYAENGFYLKSIAVYKQMQKVDPSRINIYSRLAELNEKQGLIGNALAEYRNLVAYYEKNQMAAEAINVLLKMKDIEPDNLNIRLKIAEFYAGCDQPDKSREEFREILKQLQQKGDSPRIIKLYEIFLPRFPEDFELKLGFAETCIGRGAVDQGLELLRGLLKGQPDHTGILELLALGYRRKRDFENERLIFQHLLKTIPEELKYREGFIQTCLELGDDQRALEELEERKERFLASGREAFLKTSYEQLRQVRPDDERVNKTLSSIYELTGDGDKLFELMSSVRSGRSGVDGTEEEQSEGILENLLLDDAIDDIEELEIFEAEGFEPAVEDLSPASSAGAVAEDLAAGEDLELELELELELDSGLPEFAALDHASSGGTQNQVSGSAPGLDSSVEPETESGGAQGESAIHAPLPDGEGLPESREIRERLEESEFFFQQGLYQEAEQVCRGLLDAFPDCQEAWDKLAQITGRLAQIETATATSDFIDLAGEIMEEAAALDEPPARSGEGSPFRLDGVFSDIPGEAKVGIELEDAESHYNLGIAYKEMGLLDDAIAEFDKAIRSPARMLDSLTLKGICLGEKGAFDEAEKTFLAGLSHPGLSADERNSMKFELGLLYDSWGRPLQALEAFESVADTDPFFREVGEKVAALRAQLGLGEKPNENDGKGTAKKNRVSYI